MGKKVLLIWVGLLVLMIIVAANSPGMSPDFLVIMYFVVGLIATFAYMIYDIKTAINPKNKPEVSLSVKRAGFGNISGYTLNVYGRVKNNRRVLKLMENSNYNLKYHPEQTVFTAATVGGITTGGFHTVEAHHTVSESRTGKYKINYTGGCPEAILSAQNVLPPYAVSSIYLSTDKLVEDARKTPVVCDFLKGKYLELENFTPEMAKNVNNAGKLDDPTLAMNVVLNAASQMGIDKESGKAILNWLCGE